MLEFQQLYKLKHAILITHLTFLFFLTLNAHSVTHNVLQIEDFKSKLEIANPGDEVVVKNGEYPDVNFSCTVQGSASDPIIIRPESPGGVKFTGISGFEFSGQYFEIRDFYFFRAQHNMTLHSSLVRFPLEITASDCDIRHNVFYQCGRVDNPFATIIHLKSGAQRNRITYNTMIDSVSIGITINHKDGDDNNEDNIIEHNAFYDIADVTDVHGTDNGMETIGIGNEYSTTPSNGTIVRYNYIENYTGDRQEIMTVKTGGTNVSFNTFMNCNALLSLRFGNDCHVEGNFFFNTTPPGTLSDNGGIRIQNANHKILNNYMVGMEKAGIWMMTATRPITMQGPVIGVTLINNTVLYSAVDGINIGGLRSFQDDDEFEIFLPPQDTKIYNNLIVQNDGTAINVYNGVDTTYFTNYEWLQGSAVQGETGSGINTHVNPELQVAGGFERPTNSELISLGTNAPTGVDLTYDMDRQKRDGDPDIGADEGLGGSGTPNPPSYVNGADTGAGWLPNFAAFKQDNGPDGIISFEAEDYQLLLPQAEHTWEFTTSISGFSEAGAMEAVSNSNTNFYSNNYVTDSPRMDFRFSLVSEGTIYVWIRGYGVNNGSNSCYAELDDESSTSAENVGFDVDGDWSWKEETFSGVSAGAHTLYLWMRESGTLIDKIVITSNPAYDPDDVGGGFGPDESPRLGEFHPGSWWLGTENASGQSNFPPLEVEEGPNAYGGKFVVVPPGNNSYSNEPADGHGIFEFTSEQPSIADVWLRVRAPDSGSNSFWIAHGEPPNWSAAHFAHGMSDWHWSKELSSISLQTGVNRIRIAYREDGAEIDRVLVSTDLNFNPEMVDEN